VSLISGRRRQSWRRRFPIEAPLSPKPVVRLRWVTLVPVQTLRACATYLPIVTPAAHARTHAHLHTHTCTCTRTCTHTSTFSPRRPRDRQEHLVSIHPCAHPPPRSYQKAHPKWDVDNIRYVASHDADIRHKRTLFLSCQLRHIR